MLPSPLTRWLRWSETYTKTDMVYLASSGFWTNLQVVVMSVGALVLSVAFAKLLPPETFGTYQYLVSLATIIGAFTLTGMNYAVTQAVARGFEGTLRASVIEQLKWSVLPFLIGAGASAYYFLQGNMTLGTGMALIAVLTPLANAFNSYAAFLQGKKAFKQAFVYGTILNLAYYASLIIASFYLQDALTLLFINLAVNALAAAGLYVATTKRYRPNASTDPEALPYGRNLSFLYVLTHVARQADNVLVFHFLGPVALAIYSFASAIPERLAGFFKFLFTAALPRFSVQTASSIRASLTHKMLMTTLASFGVAAAYVVSAPFLFEILFPRYMEAVPFSQAYAFLIVLAANNLSISALLSQRLKRELYLFYGLTPVVLVVLQVGLLFVYGLWGIILARLISGVIELGLSIALFYRHATPQEA